MFKATSILSILLSAMVYTGGMVVLEPLPAQAQTAKKLSCKGCVKSKQLKNNGIKSKDIGDGQVKNADLGINAVNGAKVQDNSLTGADIQNGSIGSADLANGAVTLNKLGSDVTALGLTGVAVLGPGAFHGWDGNSSDDWRISSGGYVSGTGDAGSGCIVAQADLPDGVTITEVELLFQDDSNLDFDVLLRRVSLVDGSVTQMTDLIRTSGIDDPTFRSLSDTTIDEPVVDAVDFAYFVLMDDCLFDADQRIYGVRIFYN